MEKTVQTNENFVLGICLNSYKLNETQKEAIIKKAMDLAKDAENYHPELATYKTMIAQDSYKEILERISLFEKILAAKNAVCRKAGDEWARRVFTLPEIAPAYKAGYESARSKFYDDLAAFIRGIV